ncbi:MAG: hypothetical protein ACOYLQ_09015 [Hyphomicrobiaceae bacterium]
MLTVRRWNWLVIVVAMMVATGDLAHAQKPARLALLIGNQGYAAMVGGLENRTPTWR